MARTDPFVMHTCILTKIRRHNKARTHTFIKFLFHSFSIGAMLSGPTMTRLIFMLLTCARFSNAAIPELLWSRKLPNSGTIEGEGLRKGNAVVLSDDQKSLWLTTEAGTLYVYDTDGNAIKKFRPVTTADRYTASRSSVSLYQLEYPSQSIVYAVYAVIDVPHHGENGTRSDATSRFVHIQHHSVSFNLKTWVRFTFDCA
jgi:hypothetical protein